MRETIRRELSTTPSMAVKMMMNLPGSVLG